MKLRLLLFFGRALSISFLADLQNMMSYTEIYPHLDCNHKKYE